MASSQGPACIIAPENVEPSSPVNVNESIEALQPVAGAAIDIYVDQDSPVMHKSAHFAKQPDNHRVDRRSPARDSKDSAVNGNMKTIENEINPSSPV